MKLSEFKYTLPPDLLAMYPAENRDESRLMVVDRSKGTFAHLSFRDLPSLLSEGDTIITNNTRVFPARLYGIKEKTDAKIEVFLLRELDPERRLWDVLVDPARKIRIGNKLFFGENQELSAEVIDNTTSRGRTLRFFYKGTHAEFRDILEEIGEPPIPKYIKRKSEPEDRERYQTVYASETGSVAAPTAGMHFTPQLLRKLELAGVSRANVTLHIGLGTFRPIEVEDIAKHKMDSEQFSVEESACRVVNRAMDAKKRVVAIGTTSMRAIESAVSAGNRLKPASGWTDKFIYAPYEFRIANSLLTNFHLPESTLLMVTCAFGGHDLIMRAYKEAVKEKYRFFSYGDAMMII